jgi:hypothetical protein
MHDPGAYARRVIELHGGHERFFTLIDDLFREFNAIWDQDTHSIGRVLRAHLAADYFMTAAIASTNPHLGSLESARLSFSQKVELIPDDDPSMSFLKPGLRRLNTIRNRMAHRLRVDITAEDREAFLNIQMFTAMRNESARYEGLKPDDPLSVTEQFAMFAASLLHGASDPQRHLWRQAAQSTAEDTR